LQTIKEHAAHHYKVQTVALQRSILTTQLRVPLMKKTSSKSSKKKNSHWNDHRWKSRHWIHHRLLLTSELHAWAYLLFLQLLWRLLWPGTNHCRLP
jgi:hypothetical protein